MGTFEGDLVSFVADEHLSDVALFREFDSLLVRKLAEAPKRSAASGGIAMMKAVTAPLLLAVADGEISLPTQRLNSLLDDGFGFVGILDSFFIKRDCGGGGFRGVLRHGSRSCSILRLRSALRAGRAHEHQNRAGQFHAV